MNWSERSSPYPGLTQLIHVVAMLEADLVDGLCGLDQFLLVQLVGKDRVPRSLVKVAQQLAEPVLVLLQQRLLTSVVQLLSSALPRAILTLRQLGRVARVWLSGDQLFALLQHYLNVGVLQPKPPCLPRD